MKSFLPVMIGLALSGCEQSVPPPVAPRPALVLTVGDQIAASPIVLIGEIRSRFESEQGFRVSGKVVERYVDVGANVAKGQILAKLDHQDAVLSARAAQEQLKAAEADLGLAQAELERHQQLYQRKFISRQALDIQEAKYKSATALVKQARADAAVLNNQSSYTELLAERHGVVTEIHAEPGQVVAEGETIVRIAVPENMEVEIMVPESRMQGIEINKAAEVRSWANRNQVYAGKVREISPAADTSTRTFKVRVSLPPETKNNLRLGMTASVHFYESQRQAFLLPLPAVRQYEGQTTAWVIDPSNNQAHPHTIETGMYREDGVIVTQGLKKGDLVVVAGAHTLAPGQVVRPQQAQ